MPSSYNTPQIQKDQHRLLVYFAVGVYLVLFVFLVVLALMTQNSILLAIVALMAKELAYAFHRVIDRGVNILLPS